MKRINTLFLIIVLMVSMIGCGKNIQAAWQENYDLGMRYLTEGSYEEAILSFTAAIEIDAKRIDSYIGRGDAYVLWGDTDESVMIEKYELALADFLKAVELGDQNADTYMKAANMYVGIGDIDAAIQILWKGSNSTQNRALFTRAQILELPDEIAVLTKQTEHSKRIQTGSGEFSGDDLMRGYQIYEYDENGYLVHWEDWDNVGYNGNYKWVKESYCDWVYLSATENWMQKYYILEVEYEKYSSNEEATQNANQWRCITDTGEHLPGTSEAPYYMGDLNPFPDDNPDVIENAGIQYINDENGNPILIEKYTAGGQLQYFSECEWDMIDISDLKYKKY